MTRLPERLLSIYQSFTKNHFSYKIAHCQQLAIEEQKPEVLVITCCNSRVVPRTIFMLNLNEVFTPAQRGKFSSSFLS